MIHIFLIIILLAIGIYIGMNWDKIKKSHIPSYEAMKIEFGHTVQNAYLSISHFLSSLNFLATPDEGGVSVPSVSVDNMLPGHVGVWAVTPNIVHDPEHPKSSKAIYCKPVYDFETGDLVPGKCRDQPSPPAEPAAPPPPCAREADGKCADPPPTQ